MLPAILGKVKSISKEVLHRAGHRKQVRFELPTQYSGFSDGDLTISVHYTHIGITCAVDVIKTCRSTSHALLLCSVKMEPGEFTPSQQIRCDGCRQTTPG